MAAPARRKPTTTAVVVTAEKMAAPFADPVKRLMESIESLRQMEPGPLKASVAMEYARDTNRYLKNLDASELREHVLELHHSHKRAMSWFKKLRDPAEALLRLCNQIRSDWELERRRLVDEERRKREQEANRQIEEQRQLELEHLTEIGKSEEAEALAATPIQPITVSVDADMGKPEGESMVEVWAPARNDKGEVVFDNLESEASYMTWLAAHLEFYSFVKHQYAKLKKFLTDNRGLVQPPGLTIEHRFEPRTRAGEEGYER